MRFNGQFFTLMSFPVRQDKIQLSSTTESITNTFVEAALFFFFSLFCCAPTICLCFREAALNVYRHLLSISELRAILLAMDEKFSPASPLNSVYKLQTLVTKADKSAKVLMGYLQYVMDACGTQDVLGS